MNFCTGCSHYDGGYRGYRMPLAPQSCRHPRVREFNPVSGFVTPEVARTKESLCGHEGRFFAAKPPEPPKPARTPSWWARLFNPTMETGA